MCLSQTNIISMSRRIVVRQFSMYSSSGPGHFDILHDNIRPWELCTHRVKVLPEVVSGGGCVVWEIAVLFSHQPAVSNH